MVADVPVGVLLSGGIDSSVIVALLADAGQHGLQTFSIGFERVGDREGDEFEFSDLIAKEFDTDHHQLMMPSTTVLDGLDGAVAGDERADGQPRLHRLLPAVRGGVASTSRWCSPDRAPTNCSPVTTGTRRWRTSPPEQALEVYAAHFFDRNHQVLGEILQPQWMTPDDPSRDFVREHFDRPGATARAGQGAAARLADHAGRRPGQAGGQHDDGLGAGGQDPVPGPRVRRARRRLPAGTETRARTARAC